MKNLQAVLFPILKDDIHLSDMCSLLVTAWENDVCRFEAFSAIAGEAINDLLLELWEWKLIIPVRSSKCGEWDSRILLAAPGEVFEMPNISRVLMGQAIKTGEWDSRQAIVDLFKVMGEPDWEKIPDLVLEIKNACVYHTVTGARIGAACVHNGLAGKTGAMIAILKGSGIISPKLMALSGTATSPLYEFNPCVYAELEGMSDEF
ncbi:MAG: hypothetical protein KAH09_00475 [Desulfobacula sp.]|nr:hypothetical protein [Desulfobacula sp.]